MSKVITHMTMSLDGYIATDTDGVEALFEWYDAGPIELASANPAISFHLDEPGAEFMRNMIGSVGALVSGRHLFDITNGWGDQHPVGAPVVVVTHEAPPDKDRWPRTSFVGGVEEAITLAESIAGEKDVVISSADIVGQALDLKLIDEIAVSLVPVLMGSGKAFFGTFTQGPIALDDPIVMPGTRATHLRYRVRK